MYLGPWKLWIQIAGLILKVTLFIPHNSPSPFSPLFVQDSWKRLASYSFRWAEMSSHLREIWEGLSWQEKSLFAVLCPFLYLAVSAVNVFTLLVIRRSSPPPASNPNHSHSALVLNILNFISRNDMDYERGGGDVLLFLPGLGLDLATWILATVFKTVT